MIDHEGLIKEARAWIVKPGSGELLERLAGALEARVLSPSEGDLGLLGPKEALHAAAEGECEACKSDDGDEMCSGCNCWKLTREYCS